MNKATDWEQTHCSKSLQRNYSGNSYKRKIQNIRTYVSDYLSLGTTTSKFCNLAVRN